MHPPGVEPGPIAWKAIILPLDQECLMKEWTIIKKYIHNLLLLFCEVLLSRRQREREDLGDDIIRLRVLWGWNVWVGEEAGAWIGG